MRTIIQAGQWKHVRAAVGAAGLAACVGLPAAACSILPPPVPPAPVHVPGESEAEFQARASLHFDGFNALEQQRTRETERARQLNAWTQAERVAVVEIVSLQTDVEIPQHLMGRGARATVKPVGWLKGRAGLKKKAARTTFGLAHVSYTSCGASPNWPVFSGKPGDRFVVLLNGDAPSQAAVLDVVTPADIVLPELMQAMAGEVRQAK